MNLLEPCADSPARALFAGLNHHLAVEAAFCGAVGAELYVDDPLAPRLGFMRVVGRGFLAGNPQDDPARQAAALFLQQQVMPRLKKEKFDAVQIFFHPQGWGEFIDDMLPQQQVVVVERRHFLRSTSNLPQVNLPPGIELRQVTAQLLAEPGLMGLRPLREEMCSERASVEEFLRQSFGVTAWHGRALAGWCLSEYNCAGRCEVGIGTQAPYRQRGLALAMGAEFLHEAARRGVQQVGWDCFASNLPSVRTALRLGFELCEEYTAGLAWLSGAL